MATLRDPASAALPPRSRARRVIDVVDDRLGITALEYPVPEHANNLAWSLGGVTAAAFTLLIVTGILLVQFYNPVPEAANQSVRDMVTDVWGMGFVRALHFWAAQAMYVTAALHLIRVFITGSYKRPREGNWLVGVAMFGLVILGLFTGTVLKWDQEGFEALGHNLEVGKLLGGAGLWFSAEFADRVPILVRLYGAHVVIIPASSWSSSRCTASWSSGTGSPRTRPCPPTRPARRPRRTSRPSRSPITCAGSPPSDSC